MDSEMNLPNPPETLSRVIQLGVSHVAFRSDLTGRQEHPLYFHLQFISPARRGIANANAD